MFCRNCGAQIAPETLNCPNCGTPTGVTQASQQPNQPPPVYCSNCGVQNHPMAVCCANCGAPLRNTPINVNAKSRLAAGILAILIGYFGVHNFYLGYTGKAIAQLLITVLSFGLLSWVSLIWSVIEGIQILTGAISTDANGVPFKD